MSCLYRDAFHLEAELKVLEALDKQMGRAVSRHLGWYVDGGTGCDGSMLDLLCSYLTECSSQRNISLYTHHTKLAFCLLIILMTRNKSTCFAKTEPYWSRKVNICTAQSIQSILPHQWAVTARPGCLFGVGQRGDGYFVCVHSWILKELFIYVLTRIIKLCFWKAVKFPLTHLLTGAEGGYQDQSQV